MLIRPTAFWNMIARHYANQPVADEAAYRHKLAVTAARLRPSDRLLEFGCGTGTTALIHAPRVARIDAIDFSRKMIAIAREKAERQGVSNVHFDVAAFEDWPIPDDEDRYDAVLGMSVLHLVADLDQLVHGDAQVGVQRAVTPHDDPCVGRGQRQPGELADARARADRDLVGCRGPPTPRDAEGRAEPRPRATDGEPQREAGAQGPVHRHTPHGEPGPLLDYHPVASRSSASTLAHAH